MESAVSIETVAELPAVKKRMPLTRGVNDGDYVLLLMPSDRQRIVQICGEKRINLGKYGRFRSCELIGKPYGATYAVRENETLEILHTELPIPRDTSDSVEPIDLLGAVDTTENTNMDIFDDARNQKLSHEQIMELRTRATGEEIISEIVSNNQSFTKKTKFSQEKYLKRKKSRFLCQFELRQVDAVTLCENFFAQANPGSVPIRIDIVSIILAATNIRADSRILLVDDTAGVLACAILDRMGGKGQLFALQETRTFQLETVKFMNFTEAQLAPLTVLPICHAFPLPEEEPISEIREQHQNIDIAGRRNDLMSGNFDALIVASNSDPVSIFTLVEPLLAPSRPLAVFNQSPTLLYPIFAHLRSSENYVLVSENTTWFRTYQMLPGRTHPMMRMSGHGGALVTATKIYTGQPVPSTLTGADIRDLSKKGSTKKRKIGVVDTVNDVANEPLEIRLEVSD